MEKEKLFDADFNQTAYGRKQRQEINIETLEKKQMEDDRARLGPLFNYVYHTTEFVLDQIKKI